jgi:hypothetical protein
MLQAPKNDILFYVMLVFLAVGFLLSFALPAKSHSWYDPDCCSDADCEPVQSVQFVASDEKSLPVMIVTTSLGTKPLTSRTKIRQSKDSRMHGCIFMGHLICVYMPPGQ